MIIGEGEGVGVTLTDSAALMDREGDFVSDRDLVGDLTHTRWHGDQGTLNRGQRLEGHTRDQVSGGGNVLCARVADRAVREVGHGWICGAQGRL